MLFTRTLIVIFVTFLFLSPMMAQKLSEYIFKKGDTVSDILWNNGYKPLYGNGNYVELTLKLNNMSEVTAKKIPIGKTVLFPPLLPIGVKPIKLLDWLRDQVNLPIKPPSKAELKLRFGLPGEDETPTPTPTPTPAPDLSMLAINPDATPIPTPTAVSTPDFDPEYTELKSCFECHKEVINQGRFNPHETSFRKTGGVVGKKLCGNCHGPGKEHQEENIDDPDLDPTTKTIIAYSRFADQNIKKLNARCLNCHETNTKVSFFKHTEHAEGVKCSDCHQIHKTYKPKKFPLESDRDRMNKICARCHKDVDNDLNRLSHHPVKEGRMGCVDCHNPHGTLEGKLLKGGDIVQHCTQCHAEKRGPYVWEHPPVTENCLTCHRAHGSRYTSLLKQKVPHLCQDCHNFVGHSSAGYDRTSGFESSNPAPQFVGRSCLNCHSLIHGSTGGAGSSNNRGKYFVR